MIGFRTKKDVIDWAERNLPRQYMSIERTFREGRVEFYGGFRHVIGISCPGWMIKLESKRHKNYYLFVACGGRSLFRPILYVINETQIKWRFWDGDNSNNPLYQGDNPSVYKELKEKNNGQNEK